MASGKTPAHPHAGHRERLRARYYETGLSGFADHEILELLLTFAIPQKDTNETAHLLLKTFGSLPDVLLADPQQLRKVPGIGEISACLISLFAPVARKLFATTHEETYLTTGLKAAQYIASLLFGLKTECLYLICMDNSFRVLHKSIVAEGSIDTVPVYIRDIVSVILQHNTTNILLAHNHPGGNVLPSRQDIQVTHDLANALQPLGIRLCDHIIVSGQQYYSFADKKTHLHPLITEADTPALTEGVHYLNK